MEIVLSGSIAVDRIMVFKGRFKEVIQPEKLHVLSLSLLLEDLQETPGGVAANIAYSLALLGEEPILVGSVGQKDRSYMDSLAVLGVNTDSVHYSAKPTASFSVITDQDNCQVGGFYPGAMSDASKLTFEPWFDQSAFMVVSPHDPQQMKVQVQQAKQHHLRLFYDVGQQVNNIPAEDIREGLEAAELLIVNDYELGVIAQKTGMTAAQIMKKPQVCVVTLGEKGCKIMADGHETSVSATKVKTVVDPTGAGDAFRAGFLFGYVRGWKPEKCAKLGAVVAGFAIQHTGTQSHSFTMNEVKKQYLAAFNEALDSN